MVKIMKMISTLLAICSLTACATKDPGKLRDEDPFTLALDGIHIRPSKNLGVGFQDLSIKRENVGIARDDYPYARELLAKGATRSGTEFNYSLLYYPWEKSSFFLGLNGGTGEIKLSFYERPAAGGEEPILVEYVERDVVLGPAFGWTWMFRYGLTFHLNLGPRIQISKHTRFDAGGDGSGVDEAERDLTIIKAGKTSPLQYGPNYRGVTLMFGFSF